MVFIEYRLLTLSRVQEPLYQQQAEPRHWYLCAVQYIDDGDQYLPTGQERLIVQTYVYKVNIHNIPLTDSLEGMQCTNTREGLTICFSAPDPLLYVAERVDEHSSAYHGNLSF